MPRTQPNVIITGTPGVGKSSHCEQLASQTSLKHLSINDVVKEHSLHTEYDTTLSTLVVDEDKLLDHVEPILEEGGNIVDWHVCDIFPERLIDLVVVLRAGTEALYDRLTARNYANVKLQENLDAEIMGMVEEEAREGYEEDIVMVLESNTVEDMEKNLEEIEKRIQKWREEHPEGV
ncbi:P-loop containing nucleoside triphosphate hydrolase protein [Ascodesmis nigricans]|uniref:Adenylate kinase isoenzyme 6 homolog n=1 Tax=Ascodesmis nigricans TaxID=341454 RepID=A0A4S2N479_9PEZI|nr:P-loop containing nucleoside triphosphate hydrolase protein [Ascodesmis nigricans]